MTYRLTPIEKVERLTKLADIIEEHPDQFDMDWWVQAAIPSSLGDDYYLHKIDNVADIDSYEVDLLAPDCKTRACVAGWTVCLWAGELDESYDQMGIEHTATTLLGLDRDIETRDFLFDCDAKHQEAGEAAEVIRDLAEHIANQGSSYGFKETYLGRFDA